MNLIKICFVALLTTVASSLAGHTQATTIGFDQITTNGVESPAGQLTVDVSDSAGRVLFKFSNAGPLASRISEVYWDDDSGLLTNGPDVDGSSTSGGVDLSDSPASPSNLPSGNTVSFAAEHSSGRKMSAANGVDPGEMAGFLFDGDLTTVVNALGNGSLRIGMHVISIGSAGQSESFVNVPEPATLATLAIGICCLGSCRRRLQA